MPSGSTPVRESALLEGHFWETQTVHALLLRLHMTLSVDTIFGGQLHLL